MSIWAETPRGLKNGWSFGRQKNQEVDDAANSTGGPWYFHRLVQNFAVSTEFKDGITACCEGLDVTGISN